MPTGHTAAIMEGRVTTLEDFAMSCLRSFGTCIEMRDAPADTPIPEEFQVSSYHLSAVEEAKAELAKFESMTVEVAEVEAQAEWHREYAEWQKRQERRTAENSRLDKMKAKVEVWNCPDLMSELKPFMLNQIEISYESGSWDKEPVSFGGSEWLTIKRTLAAEQLAYREKQLLEAQERVNGRNQALAEIRASLKEVAG